MFYVYVLQSLKDARKYIGSTSDLKRRFQEHNSGNFPGTYTQNHRPFKLIYYEAYIEKVDVLRAEKFYKTGYGREILRGKLDYFLKSK